MSHDSRDGSAAPRAETARAIQKSGIRGLGLDVAAFKAELLKMNVGGSASITLGSVINDAGKTYLDRKIKEALDDVAQDKSTIFNPNPQSAKDIVAGLLMPAIEKICTRKERHNPLVSFQYIAPLPKSLPALGFNLREVYNEILDSFLGDDGLVLRLRIKKEGTELLGNNLQTALRATIAKACNPAATVESNNAFFDLAVIDTVRKLESNRELTECDSTILHAFVVKIVAKTLVREDMWGREDKVAKVAAELTPLIQAALRTEDGGNRLNAIPGSGDAGMLHQKLFALHLDLPVAISNARGGFKENGKYSENIFDAIDSIRIDDELKVSVVTNPEKVTAINIEKAKRGLVPITLQVRDAERPVILDNAPTIEEIRTRRLASIAARVGGDPFGFLESQENAVRGVSIDGCVNRIVGQEEISWKKIVRKGREPVFEGTAKLAGVVEFEPVSQAGSEVAAPAGGDSEARTANVNWASIVPQATLERIAEALKYLEAQEEAGRGMGFGGVERAENGSWAEIVAAKGDSTKRL